MGKAAERRPQAVMISKRANVFYLEHVRVMQKDGLVVYMTEASDKLDQFVSIPDKNTAFILLGKGSSITDAAMRNLAESNVLVGFCGSGGSPLFAMEDITFLVPQDEYRPTEYAQRWMQAWLQEPARVGLAKAFLRFRVHWARDRIRRLQVDLPDQVFDGLLYACEQRQSTQDLLLVEALYAKQLYRHYAEIFGVQQFTREPGKKKKQTIEEKVNGFLDHGNYLAYGYASVALHGLGIPYFLPVLHGKTRRGALVFDVADLFKDWLIMPLAFEAGKAGWEDARFRANVIERAMDADVLDECMTFLKECVAKISINQQDGDPAVATR